MTLDLEQLDDEARRCKMFGQFSAALALRQTLERQYDETAADPQLVTANLNMLAYLAACRGERAEAIRAAEKCLALYKLTANQDDQKVATYTMMLSSALAEGGQFQAAVRFGEEAVSMFGRLLGENADFVHRRRKELDCMRTAEVRDYLDKNDSVGSS